MGERFDVVVVGAGAAGAVVAARVSEDPRRRVCLVEAGPDYPNPAELPADLADGHDNSYVDHDWGLRYVPVASRPDRDDRFPRGRVTGGSSAVNTTIALRGTPADFDAWADAGAPAWSWEQVLPAYCRLERDLDFGAAPYHGDAGPITVRRFRAEELVPTQAAFLEACERAGHPRCADVNAPDAIGAATMAVNKLGRLRISTAIGYLAPARYRPNLVIRPRTVTHRVVTDGRRRAIGIEAIGADGGLERIDADLVVLSAGAVHTPGILVRSGVGRREELDRLGIDAVAHLEGVGANLADHPALAVVCIARHPELCAPDLPLVQTITRYTAAGSDRPLDVNIELITRARWGSNRAAPPGPAAFLLAPSLEQVDGRGEVRQRSADPASPPIVDPAFGQHDGDLRRHIGALRDAIALAGTAPLADFVEGIAFPDPARTTDDDLLGVAGRVSASGYHPCGTARMGAPGDPQAVVDQYGRCLAIEGLVVADASIMPSIPRANTNLTTIMIGEMIGEWLRVHPEMYRS